MTIYPKLEQLIKNATPHNIEEYNKYWQSIAPKNLKERYWRFVFAFLSVHTTWEANVRSYKLLVRDFDYVKNDLQELTDLLIRGRAGLYNMRAKGIHQFTQDFFLNSNQYEPIIGETWFEFRNRIMNKLFGLGLAKTSFALEMCYPLATACVCLDTHMLDLYGLSDKKSKANNIQAYIKMEKHWGMEATKLGLSPYVARCMFWDEKQNQKDSRYWSHVFEK